MPTPGHVDGHVSVIVRGAGVTYFLAGDAFGKYVESEVARITGILKDIGLAT